MRTQEKAPRRVWAKLCLVVFGLGVGLALSEFGLRIVEKIKARELVIFSQKYVIRDPRLAHRIAPNAPGHDAKGFRNIGVPDRVDVVALGDSHTWGQNAELAGSWPETLGRTSGRTVYNMGISNYGPVQYWLLTKEALSLSPRVIVVGLFSGNDLYNAYDVVYKRESYLDLRSPNPSSELLTDTIELRAKALQAEMENFQNNVGRNDRAAWGLWLRGHTAIGRLLDRAGVTSSLDRSAWDEIYVRWAQAHPDRAVVYDDGNVNTVITTFYRLGLVNVDDPRISEGRRITLELLRRIKTEADRSGAHLVLLLIPSKEMVFADAVKSRDGGLEPTYQKLVQMETRIREAVIAECKSTSIEYADALPALAAAIGRREQVYPPLSESHPTTLGYAVIAGVVKKKLEELTW